MIRSSAAALVVLVCALGPRSAHAQQAPSSTTAEDPKQEAARRYGTAIKLYEDGDYPLALAEFERVYELVPDYRVLYNIGQVSMQLGRYARALRTLREYVGRGGDAIPPDRRSAVRADLEVLEARTATLTLNIQPEGAEIWIDGVLIGQAPLAQPVVVDVGERTVQVRRAGYVGRAQAITLAGSDQREVVLKLDPEAATVQNVPLPPRGPAPVGPRRNVPAARESRPLLWVGWGATATLAAGSAVAAVLGASSASSLKDLRSDRSATREALDDEQDRARARFLAADIFGVAALAAGATTLYFQLSGSGQRERAAEQARLGLSVLPNGVSVRVEH